MWYLQERISDLEISIDNQTINKVSKTEFLRIKLNNKSNGKIHIHLYVEKYLVVLWWY